MPQYHGRDLRKPTGGKIRPHRKKRKYEMGGDPIETTVAESERRIIRRVMGGNCKVSLKHAVYANVLDPETNKCYKLKILAVKENPSCIDYSRRGVITKGSIIETEKGLARVTSRPGQDGVINAVLVKTQG
ncbi:MAG: 30S ribosomal protein S8e [Candidatus Nezhaarchaeota archaeon]|nr:30S ribosomal protein S8e [Candidatus Nezhaarchaeota archaeon]MCX8141969.1 30S ribosomal protein S8e [Candidatus Nezhaarchaeota archaeon]MDW8050250.1 30S ribosomal protein S8e [Nitrososphaerota archaeon]